MSHRIGSDSILIYRGHPLWYFPQHPPSVRSLSFWTLFGWVCLTSFPDSVWRPLPPPLIQNNHRPPERCINCFEHTLRSPVQLTLASFFDDLNPVLLSFQPSSLSPFDWAEPMGSTYSSLYSDYRSLNDSLKDKTMYAIFLRLFAFGTISSLPGVHLPVPDCLFLDIRPRINILFFNQSIHVQHCTWTSVKLSVTLLRLVTSM